MKRASDLWHSVIRQYKKGLQAYSAFMEKQGFYLVLTICVLVIVGTAVWTRATRTPTPPPSLTEGQAADVPYEGVQRMADVTTAIPSSTRSLPSPTPLPSFSRPVPGAILRGFDAEQPVFFESTGLWQLHSACDYQAKTGDVVKSVGDGTVVGVADGGMLGKSVTIDYGGSIAVVYGGLSMNSYVKTGDPVEQGQAIGHIGNTTLFETGDGPHLHLSMARSGQPINPETFFTSNNP